MKVLPYPRVWVKFNIAKLSYTEYKHRYQESNKGNFFKLHERKNNKSIKSIQYED